MVSHVHAQRSIKITSVHKYSEYHAKYLKSGQNPDPGYRTFIIWITVRS